MAIRLSKSKLIAYRQCPKKLWLEVHRPDLKVEDQSAQQRFEAGYRIGDFAQRQYPDGILIAPDNNLPNALKETQEHLNAATGKVLFEATFQAHGLLVRADLLVPTKSGWHMVEVKSSTKVKPYHIEDAAIQSWVAKNAGLNLSHTSLQVVDSKWTYPGGNHYSGLLKLEAVDDKIAPLQSEVPKWLASAQAVVSTDEPNIKIGKQCNDPFSCAFQSHCESLTAPIQFPINWLPNLHHTKRAKFEAAGFVELTQLPAGDLSAKQQKVLDATINNKVFFEPLTAAEKKQFNGTRYYLDFETIAFTIPIWEGTRPYQQVPFQWSCHIEKPDGTITHDMFLDLSGNDPSRQFAEGLVATLGRTGPIVVYNQGFEKRIIKELAQRFDDLAPRLTLLLDRVVDLLPITGAHYYHPDMQGSWSIKAVLPTIAPDLDYANLVDVSDGGGAQEAFLEATHSDTTSLRKTQLEAALRAYCYRDTEAMIRVLHFLMA